MIRGQRCSLHRRLIAASPLPLPLALPVLLPLPLPLPLPFFAFRGDSRLEEINHVPSPWRGGPPPHPTPSHSSAQMVLAPAALQQLRRDHAPAGAGTAGLASRRQGATALVVLVLGAARPRRVVVLMGGSE
jgi:hypothetical protein